MKSLLGLLMIFAIYIGWKFICELWSDWSGVFGRWRRGEPLRNSDVWALRMREEREREEEERVRLRSLHARDSSLILDPDFRRRFKQLGLHVEIRASVFNRYENTCAACGKKPKRKGLHGLHVDHIRPVSLYPELEFAFHNLQLLCASCNRHKHDYDGTDWKEVTLARKKFAAKRKRAGR